MEEAASPGLASIIVQNLIREACDDVLDDHLGGLTALILVGHYYRVCLHHMTTSAQLVLEPSPAAVQLIDCTCMRAGFRV